MNMMDARGSNISLPFAGTKPMRTSTGVKNWVMPLRPDGLEYANATSTPNSCFAM